MADNETETEEPGEIEIDAEVYPGAGGSESPVNHALDSTHICLYLPSDAAMKIPKSGTIELEYELVERVVRERAGRAEVTLKITRVEAAEPSDEESEPPESTGDYMDRVLKSGSPEKT